MKKSRNRTVEVLDKFFATCTLNELIAGMEILGWKEQVGNPPSYRVWEDPWSGAQLLLPGDMSRADSDVMVGRVKGYLSKRYGLAHYDMLMVDKLSCALEDKN